MRRTVNVDVLALANWQRQGKKGGRRPKPYPRPGKDGVQRIGRGGLPLAELDAWIAEQESMDPADVPI